jgi:hypothetical protein
MMGLCTAFRLWQARCSDQESLDTRKPAKLRPKISDETFPPTSPLSATPSMLNLTESSPIPTLSTARFFGEGTARWRARLKQENRDKVIVFVADVYGIFHMAEFAILMGVRLKELPPHLGSREAILTRYGLSP